jgi:tyrosyl-DNA phosphodiesterase-1
LSKQKRYHLGWNHLSKFIFSRRNIIANQDEWKSTEKVQVISPPIVGYGCQHVKLCVLVFHSMLRIVVSSANLISYDWQGMENIGFVQDFPLIREKNELVYSATSSLYSELGPILRDLGVPEGTYQVLRACDCSRWKAKLIFSRNGSFAIPKSLCNAGNYGGVALARWTKQLWQSPPGPLILEYATSSLGALDAEFLKMAQGWVRGDGISMKNVIDEWRILFPTQETVRNSVYGAEVLCSLLLAIAKVSFQRLILFWFAFRAGVVFGSAKTCGINPRIHASAFKH